MIVVNGPEALGGDATSVEIIEADGNTTALEDVSKREVAEQQKAMAVTMPILFGFIFYNFPSGLALYFLTNSIFSFVLQVSISRSNT